MTSPDADRRLFVRGMAMGSMAMGLPMLSACKAAPVDFLHGVASGDPLSDAVILWTRVTPGPQLLDHWASLRSDPQARAQADTDLLLERIRVEWQVFKDPQMRQAVASGAEYTDAKRDFTVKIDVNRLQADTAYWFRFRAMGRDSTLGRTRTLPKGKVDQVRWAVVSCSSFAQGYFNVYADIAKHQDLHAVLHLGDYIYEYKGYGDVRPRQPASELLTLADYRTRHAQYRTDADAQAMHARHPMIAVWDDHEFANDAWMDGAQNHTPATEGPWHIRRAAALQAYREWMPIRLPDVRRPERIYRRFDFGDLASLYMLDTRLIGRSKPVRLRAFGTPANYDHKGLRAALNDPSRHLLGADQELWLKHQLTHSSARWQVLGQQVIMAPRELPVEVAEEPSRAAHDMANRAPQSASAPETLPMSVGAWDGYAAARERVFLAASEAKKRLVVLTGDSHNAWAFNLKDRNQNPIGVEFATPSVTSPGMESSDLKPDPAQLAASLARLIDNLVYVETRRRGYMLVTATPQSCQADWVFVDTVLDRRYTSQVAKSLLVRPSPHPVQLVESVPSGTGMVHFTTPP